VEIGCANPGISWRLFADGGTTGRSHFPDVRGELHSGWRNRKHGAQWGVALEGYTYPMFGDPPVQAVDTGLVVKVLKPIWATTRGHLENLLPAWGKARWVRHHAALP
jgi:hypothetical protein